MAISEKFQSTNNSKPLKKQVLLEIGGRGVRMDTFSGRNIILTTIFWSGLKLALLKVRVIENKCYSKI